MSESFVGLTNFYEEVCLTSSAYADHPSLTSLPGPVSGSTPSRFDAWVKKDEVECVDLRLWSRSERG